MKYQVYSTYLLILLLISVQLCSSTLLAGAMFYYLMGNYITRQVFPNILNSAFKSIVQQPSIQYTSQSSTGTDSNSNTNTVAEIMKIGKVLGINRRLDNYMKDLWPELDCSINPCDKKKQMKKKKAISSESESEEETNDEISSNSKLTSEELTNYVIKAEEDVERLADEELADEDPYSFYYIMKDQHKKKLEKESQFNYEDEESENFHRNPKDIQPLPAPSVVPVFSNLHKPRQGYLPIFIRHKVPYTKSVNYAYNVRRRPRIWSPYNYNMYSGQSIFPTRWF